MTVRWLSSGSSGGTWSTGRRGGPRGAPPVRLDDGSDAVARVHDVLERVFAFASAVRAGEVRGAPGKKPKGSFFFVFYLS